LLDATNENQVWFPEQAADQLRMVRVAGTERSMWIPEESSPVQRLVGPEGFEPSTSRFLRSSYELRQLFSVALA